VQIGFLDIIEIGVRVDRFHRLDLNKQCLDVWFISLDLDGRGHLN
jgi:hypothetical protein